jgi:hypothetical protein
MITSDTIRSLALRISFMAAAAYISILVVKLEMLGRLYRSTLIY